MIIIIIMKYYYYSPPAPQIQTSRYRRWMYKRVLYHRAASYRHWTAVQCHELGQVLGFGICNLLHRSLSTLTKGPMAPLYLQIHRSYVNSGFLDDETTTTHNTKCHSSLKERGGCQSWTDQSTVQCCMYQSQFCPLCKVDPQMLLEGWFPSDNAVSRRHHMFDCMRSIGSSCSNHSPL